MSGFAFLPESVVTAWPDLSAPAKAVAVSLASFTNGDGTSWPSREAIAQRAGIRKLDTVTAATSELKTKGLLTVQRRARTSSVFRWTSPPVSLSHETPSQGVSPSHETPRHGVSSPDETPFQGVHETPFQGGGNYPTELGEGEGSPESRKACSEPPPVPDALKEGDPPAEGEHPVAEAKPDGQEAVVAVFDGWNAVAKAHGMPTALKLLPQRREAIRTRLKDADWREDYPKALAHIPAAKGMHGKKWANFDWFLRVSKPPKGISVQNILEGKYDEVYGEQSSQSRGAPAAPAPEESYGDPEFVESQVNRVEGEANGDK